MVNKQPKQKKCRYCGTFFIPYKSTIKNCNDLTCIKAFIEENQSKIERKTIQRKKEHKKALKESLMSISELEKQAKTVFQKYVRLRDKDLPCISCGKLNCKDWAGGHYFPAGVYSGLIFDERNCHKQCNSHCNMYLSGNLINYRIGLIKRFGEDFVNELESEANEKRNYKYTRDELKEIKENFQGKINELNNK